jgi:hypothetical protein
VSDALKQHGVDPSNLELELTESLLLDESDHVEVVLRDLRSIGVRIALDDFGTGYSALTYLNRFNLDGLKMDRGLLRDIDSNPSALGIASAVVAMAHSLGLTVVAEGVDVEEQVGILQNMCCDQIQGFLFAPALPPDEVVRFMARPGEPVPICTPVTTSALRRESPGESEEHDLDEEDLLPAPRMLDTDTDSGRVLIVDDGAESLGHLALRLGRIGIDTHYAATADEGQLFVHQEGDAIRVIGAPPTVDFDRLVEVRESLDKISGEKSRLVVIGEKPDDAVRDRIREIGADWVLWAPFNDAELRSLLKSAITRSGALADRRESRVPVDLVATIASGKRREVAVVSSLSPRGAFLEMADPLPRNTSLRIVMDLPGERFRGFARVLYVQHEDPEQPAETSGMGVEFFGADPDTERLLCKAVKELEARYQP